MRTDLNAAIRDIPIPPRMAQLPISPKGFPTPWFVHIADDGAADFRVIGRGKMVEAHNGRKCWLCGQPRGTHLVFTIGPMCTVNRISGEPPSHLACAEYAVRACPFLAKPNMRRNELDMIEEATAHPGALLHNPGVTALWVCRSYKVESNGDGALFHLGPPERVEWYTQGRQATRAEVEAAIAAGYPLLAAQAARDGADAAAELSACLARSRAWLPAAAP